MKNYLIVNAALDTFATVGERVLFFPQSMINTAILLNPEYRDNYLTVAVTPDIDVIVCDKGVESVATILAKEQVSAVVWLSFRELIADIPTQTAHLLARALQLTRFYQDHHFCSRCGTKTTLRGIDTAMICPSCDYHQYPRLQPCIITAIVKQDKNSSPKILLAHHQRAKSSGMYGLIAGFVEVGESLEDCVHREVKEEVNLQVSNLRYFASQPWPFPSNLMVGFIADYVSGDIHIQAEELIHADFFGLDDLPKVPQAGTIAHDLIMAVKKQYSDLWLNHAKIG